mmetsp:Transcript_28950/g.112645  ORF Transcript_28950/g.112645 Transcript_28950/m.112645 type:complete len:105 (-) Transcript_28950:4294-4608(-)
MLRRLFGTRMIGFVSGGGLGLRRAGPSVRVRGFLGSSVRARHGTARGVRWFAAPSVGAAGAAEVKMVATAPQVVSTRPVNGRRLRLLLGWLGTKSSSEPPWFFV